MRCQHCKNKVLQKSGDVVRLRLTGPIEIHPNGKTYARCHWCKAQMVVKLNMGLEDPIPTERFFVKS